MIPRTAISAAQSLPGKIIGVTGMPIDETQQPLMEHLVERRAASQPCALLRRKAEAEQQGRRARDQPDKARME